VKILFVMDRRVNAGSIQAVASYVSAGDKVGHTIALYGIPEPTFAKVRFSTNPGDFDYVVFIIEFGLSWMSGLRMPRFLASVPREQRVVLDADGMYNQLICVDGYDRNHRNECERSRWVAHCNSLTDKILQPTLHPREPKVVGLPFYGYDTESHLDVFHRPAKQCDIVHLAHNWWRWRQVSDCLLPAFERIRFHLDGICFVGSWWEAAPAGAWEQHLDTAFGNDPERFRALRIQVKPPVPYTDVIRTMSEGRVNIMTQRPLFRHLKLFTSKYFEIFSADTIPLVMLDPDHAESVYGPAGRELALYEDIGAKLLDVLEHPLRYDELVREVRLHLAEHHSYQMRVHQLVTALRKMGGLN
jgi:hypothetical protein